MVTGYFFFCCLSYLFLLLRTLQKKKIHMAVVVDEFGGTEGLVTLDSVAVIDYDAVWAAEHKDEFVAQFEANIASSENLE